MKGKSSYTDYNMLYFPSQPLPLKNRHSHCFHHETSLLEVLTVCVAVCACMCVCVCGLSNIHWMAFLCKVLCWVLCGIKENRSLAFGLKVQTVLYLRAVLTCRICPITTCAQRLNSPPSALAWLQTQPSWECEAEMLVLNFSHRDRCGHNDRVLTAGGNSHVCLWQEEGSLVLSPPDQLLLPLQTGQQLPLSPGSKLLCPSQLPSHAPQSTLLESSIAIAFR